METIKLKKPDHKNQLRHMNTKYLERLQKIMDAANTRTSSIQLRKKFIEHQNRMNYRNEFDRLRGAFSQLGNDDLIRQAIQQYVGPMGIEKLKDIGEYQEPQELSKRQQKKQQRRLHTPGVRIRAEGETRGPGRPRSSIDITTG